MYEFKEELELDDPAKSIEIILDTPLAILEGHHELKMRIVNLLEEHLGCIYIRDLLEVTKHQLAKVYGIGEKETYRLRMCLIDIQKIINALDKKQQQQWKDAQCKLFLLQEVPVT